MTDLLRRTAKNLRAERIPLLRIVWEAWVATLPPEAETTWRRGAAYVRESSTRSLVGDAADTQLRNTLAMLARKQVYVPWEGIFFDNATGTDLTPRTAFRLLREQATAGGFKVVGVFVADRMFRNLEQSMMVKREFRVQGVEVMYFGKWEGDPRSPAAFQLEVIQDMQAETVARQTGLYVGMAHEASTRLGNPVGLLPEGFVVTERARAFGGHDGGPIAWAQQEPLCSIIAEGRKRYMAGDTYIRLGEWSKTTELCGVTPKGHVMNAHWWLSTLTNPKYAGYQMPTSYQGFRPGKESPKRPRRRRDSELVPSKLPALWTLEEHYALVDEASRRQHKPKNRKVYRSYLLSGVAYDARCGHRMRIHSKFPDGTFRMICHKLEAGGAHSTSVRAEVAEGELDELLAHLEVQDEDLARQVEEELHKLTNAEEVERERFRPDPAIAVVRRALAEMTRVGLDNDNLRRQLGELEVTDATRKEALQRPIVEFRRALEGFEKWPEIWQAGDTAKKNELLRAVGLRVIIGRDEGVKDGPVHLLAIQSDNTVFQLALATVLSKSERTLGIEEPSFVANVRRTIVDLTSDFVGIAGQVLGDVTDAGLSMKRPELVVIPKPRCSTQRPTRWYSVRTAAERAGVSKRVVRRWLYRGLIPSTRTPVRGSWRILPTDLEDFLARDLQSQAETEHSQPGIRKPQWSAPASGDWVTIQEATEVTGASQRNVRSAISGGRLQATRVGKGYGKFYLHRAELEAWARSWVAIENKAA